MDYDVDLGHIRFWKSVQPMPMWTLKDGENDGIYKGNNFSLLQVSVIRL